MDKTLKPYQRVGVDWLKTKKKALLADEMGLGKTAQAIMAAKELGLARILIVCPAIARKTWQREIHQWWPGKESFIIGVENEDNGMKDTWIVSFDYLTRHLPLFTMQHWDLVVVDESHFVKSITTKRTHAVLNPTIGLITSSKVLWLMTGTPMPNHPGELYPVLRSFGEYTKTHEHFVREFCTWYEYRGREVVTGVKTRSLPKLREMLSRIMLRRKKKNVLKDLPPITITITTVEGELNKLPDELKVAEKNLLASLNKTAPMDQMKVLEAMASSISTLRRYAGMQKVEGVVKLVCEEIENKTYKQIVIFGVHTDVIEGLAQGFKKRKLKVGVITGATPINKRQDIVDLFQKSELDIFIGNVQAAGTNITLTAADQVMSVELSWVPAENEQAWARCHRIGQVNAVYVRVAVLENSVDEKVAEVLVSKTSTINKIFGDNKGQDT